MVQKILRQKKGQDKKWGKGEEFSETKKGGMGRGSRKFPIYEIPQQSPPVTTDFGSPSIPMGSWPRCFEKKTQFFWKFSKTQVEVYLDMKGTKVRITRLVFWDPAIFGVKGPSQI